LAGWLKSRSLSHQVAAVDRLLKAMTLGMAWQPAQQQRFMLVIQLAEPHGGTLTLPVGQEALPAEAERGQGAVIHHGRRDAIPKGGVAEDRSPEAARALPEGKGTLD